MWTSFRPNLWLPKRSTARRCATWRASQRRSTPSDVPSPWAPGSRELEQKATAAATTSPTSSWSRTVCRVSATPTRRWAVTRVIEPRYHFFVFVEPFACVCLQAHIPVCVCVFQWCQCLSTKRAVTAAQRRRPTRTPPPRPKQPLPRLPPLPPPPSTCLNLTRPPCSTPPPHPPISPPVPLPLPSCPPLAPPVSWS